MIHNTNYKDPQYFLEACLNLFKAKIVEVLSRLEEIKCYMVLFAEFEKEKGEETITRMFTFQSKTAELDGDTNVDGWFKENMKLPILLKMEDFTKHESGWSLKALNHLLVNINKVASYSGGYYIPLPKEIANKKACVNVRANSRKEYDFTCARDERYCFADAVVSALFPPDGGKGEYQSHIPCSIGYYVKCSYDDSLSFYRSYRGEDCIDWFCKELQQFAENVETVYLCSIPMDKLTPEKRAELNQQTSCHICEQPFNPRDIKHIDHCHLTGIIRGYAHQECNIIYQDSRTITVVFHNLSSYDVKFICSHIFHKFRT